MTFYIFFIARSTDGKWVAFQSEYHLEAFEEVLPESTPESLTHLAKIWQCVEQEGGDDDRSDIDHFNAVCQDGWCPPCSHPSLANLCDGIYGVRKSVPDGVDFTGFESMYIPKHLFFG